MKGQKLIQNLGILTLFIFTLIALSFLGLVIVDITYQGAGVLNWEFISSHPKHGMTAGGILPAVYGTAFVTFITALFAIPFGVASGIYLSEYAQDNWVNRLIRAAIRNLAGIPSIIYGLFGVAIFVQGLAFDTSILSSGLTLGLLTLPYIVTTTEEAMRTVPQSYREGALALGSTQWQAIYTNVLPSATAGIITGTILGLSRAAGETAPILFTGVAFYLRNLPTTVYDEFMALPYHLYILSTQHHAITQVRPIAYGTALVLLGLLLGLNLIAFIIRYRYRRLSEHR